MTPRQAEPPLPVRVGRLFRCPCFRQRVTPGHSSPRRAEVPFLLGGKCHGSLCWNSHSGNAPGDSGEFGRHAPTDRSGCRGREAAGPAAVSRLAGGDYLRYPANGPSLIPARHGGPRSPTGRGTASRAPVLRVRIAPRARLGGTAGGGRAGPGSPTGRRHTVQGGDSARSNRAPGTQWLRVRIPALQRMQARPAQRVRRRGRVGTACKTVASRLGGSNPSTRTLRG